VFETVQLSQGEMESLIRLLVKIRVEAGDFSSEAGRGTWTSRARARGGVKAPS
jgi:hypothetical protein